MKITLFMSDTRPEFSMIRAKSPGVSVKYYLPIIIPVAAFSFAGRLATVGVWRNQRALSIHSRKALAFGDVFA